MYTCTYKDTMIRYTSLTSSFPYHDCIIIMIFHSLCTACMCTDNLAFHAYGYPVLITCMHGRSHAVLIPRFWSSESSSRAWEIPVLIPRSWSSSHAWEIPVLIPKSWSSSQDPGPHPMHGRSQSSSQDPGPHPMHGRSQSSSQDPSPQTPHPIPCMGGPGPPPMQAYVTALI